MARAKKTVSASSTAPKTRGIDLQEVEARVTALDKAKRRSYDIFDIEQRVYNLEKNGGGSSSSLTFNLLQGVVTSASEITAGVATAKDNYPNFPAEYAFYGSSGWIAYSGSTYWEFTFTNKSLPHALTWSSTDPQRKQTPTKYEISEDGVTFTEVTPDYMDFGMIIDTKTKNKVKAIRICFDGDYSTSTYPMIAGMSIIGE